jgi:hypothetical protein
MVARAGAGPKPTRYKELTAEILAESINEALKPQTLEKAGEMAKTIAQEKGCDVGAQSFHQMLEMDKLRCSILPEQTAVWRIRRTQIRLSALAAYVLAEKEVISFSDLKLYRPNEYEVDNGPTGPISGGAGAILDNATAIAMGVADFPIAALKALAIHPDAKKEKGKQKAGDLKTNKTAKATTLETVSVAPPVSVQSEGATTTSGRASISTERSSTDLTPPTTPGINTPAEHQDHFASLQPTASPEQLATRTSLETPSSTQPDLLSPITAHSTSQSSTPVSATSMKRRSAMAEALRNLPDSSRPRSRSGSRSRAGSYKTPRSNSESSSMPQPFKHWAEQDGHEGILDTAYATGKGLHKIVGAGIKSPMDFTLGLAKGFTTCRSCMAKRSVRSRG